MLLRSFILSLAFFVTACGFTPIYKTVDSESGGVGNPDLAAIKIEAQHNLNGQFFQSRLEDLFNPKSISTPEKYVLNTKLSVTETPIDIRQDRTITRYKTSVSVEYKLTDITTGAVIDEGTLQRDGGYDKVESEYATYVSQEDTIKRITRELAENLKLRIIAVLVK